jgi:5-methylcytosine-specific restriction endonuclease McrA
VRKAHLKRNKTCAACGGKKELEVHHIVPVHLSPERELDPTNLITLCEARECHHAFGHMYDWRFGNPKVVEDAAWWRARCKNERAR